MDSSQIAQALGLMASAFKLLEDGMNTQSPAPTVAAPEGEILTCKGAAELLHLHPKIVERRARAGQLLAFRLPGTRGWRFKRAELLRWVEEGRKAA
jgi:excisionase family DNA binding protein